MNGEHYSTVIEKLPRGKARVAVPFDPNTMWGHKRVHHVGGTVAGMPVRGTVAEDPTGWAFTVGPAWLRDCLVGPGDTVEVTIAPEGPQRGDLASDLAAALDENTEAGAFFDSLAQAYRNAYIRWIDSTKRRPDVRAQRIDEVVDMLSKHVKQRPST